MNNYKTASLNEAMHALTERPMYLEPIIVNGSTVRPENKPAAHDFFRALLPHNDLG